MVNILCFRYERPACKRLLTVATDNPKKVATSWCEHSWTKKKGCGLAQAIRQFRDRCKRGGGLPTRIEDMMRQRLLIRHRFGVGQRNRDELLPPQYAKSVVADDAPEPARKGGGIGEARERRPGRDEGFLDHVLGVPEIAFSLYSPHPETGH